MFSSVNALKGQFGTDQLFGGESRHARFFQGAGPGGGAQGRDREHHLPRLWSATDMVMAISRRGARSDRSQHSDGAPGAARRDLPAWCPTSPPDGAGYITGANISINGGCTWP